MRQKADDTFLGMNPDTFMILRKSSNHLTIWISIVRIRRKLSGQLPVVGGGDEAWPWPGKRKKNSDDKLTN